MFPEAALLILADLRFGGYSADLLPNPDVDSFFFTLMVEIEGREMRYLSLSERF